MRQNVRKSADHIGRIGDVCGAAIKFKNLSFRYEIGNHRELLQQQGIYYKLYQVQYEKQVTGA